MALLVLAVNKARLFHLQKANIFHVCQNGLPVKPRIRLGIATKKEFTVTIK